MPDSPTIQVRDEIKARLERILIANGYSLDVQTVGSRRVADFEEAELPAINVSLSSENTESTQPYGSDQWEVRFGIDIRADRNLDDYDKVAANLRHEIWIALNRAVANPNVSDAVSINLGGLVSSIQLETSAPNVTNDQSAYSGTDVDVVVIFSTQLSDPYTIET